MKKWYQSGDRFGSSVVISGNTIVAGAYGESSAATGINGNQDDNSATRAGAAYIFHTGGSAQNDHFGLAVDIDGDTAVVGALDHDHIGMASAGKAWVFRRSGSTWSLAAGLIDDFPAPNDRFGVSVAASGNWVAVGADYDDINAGTVVDCGSVQVFFRYGDGSWGRRGGKLAPAAAGAQLGRSVDLNGTTLVAGAPFSNNTGRVWTWFGYTDPDGNWVWDPTGDVSAESPQVGANFGFSVAISGDHLIVGEPGRDGSVLGNPRPNSGAVTFFKKRYTDESGPVGTWVGSRLQTFN